MGNISKDFSANSMKKTGLYEYVCYFFPARLAKLLRLKDKIFLCLPSNIVCKFACGRCNAMYYDLICHHFIVRVGEHPRISPLNGPNKRINSC